MLATCFLIQRGNSFRDIRNDYAVRTASLPVLWISTVLRILGSRPCLSPHDAALTTVLYVRSMYVPTYKTK